MFKVKIHPYLINPFVMQVFTLPILDIFCGCTINICTIVHFNYNWIDLDISSTCWTSSDFFSSARSLNSKSCIYYILLLPTKLNSRGRPEMIFRSGCLHIYFNLYRIWIILFVVMLFGNGIMEAQWNCWHTYTPIHLIMEWQNQKYRSFYNGIKHK